MMVKNFGFRLMVLKVVNNVRLVIMFGSVMGSSSNSEMVFLLKKFCCYSVVAVSVFNISVINVVSVVILSDSVMVLRILLCCVVMLNQCSVRFCGGKLNVVFLVLNVQVVIIRMGKCRKIMLFQVVSLRKNGVCLECIECFQMFYECQVQCDENNWYQGECCCYWYIVNCFLLGINYIVDKIFWRINQLWDDKIVQCE